MLIRFRNRRRENPEKEWGNAARRDSRSWIVWMMSGLLLLLAGGALGTWLVKRGEEHQAARVAPTEDGDKMREGLEAAEVVARAFLKETDPARRLQWVRNADEVKARLAEYPEEVRSGPGGIEKVLGHQMDGERSVTGFVVAFPSGNLRLLEVVGTPDGPRVDWDAYARYASASWEDLWSGNAKQAVVRVFCEPSTERPEPFEDQGKWICFRMSGPELPQAALGFAAVGSVREAKMKQVILGTPNYRQRFTLEIARHEGKDEPLFEITRCLAVGWIIGERDVEDEWMKRVE
jgi:hypothetical protein